eukprot:c9014_g1_i1.p1 GENE.c9014_g1_i1~~c9014_g1_i1.p1  ORF type:complete len:298 (+),score=63.59 c9014_g1_i1:96-896(+)
MSLGLRSQDQLFLQPKRVEKKKAPTSPPQPLLDTDSKLKQLDDLNTNLAAALLVGLAKVKNENEKLKRLMEQQKSECDALDIAEANRKLRDLVDKYFNLNTKLLQRSDEQKRKVSTLESEKLSLKHQLEILQYQLQHSNSVLADVNAKYDSECKRNSSLTKHADDLEAKLQQQQERQVQQEELLQQSIRLQERSPVSSALPVSAISRCDSFSLLAPATLDQTSVTTVSLSTCPPLQSQSIWKDRVFWIVLCVSLLLAQLLLIVFCP